MTLIDKEALLEKLNTFHPDYTFNITSFRNFIKAQPEVEQIPSAQPELPPYVAEIEEEYQKAVNSPYINKPLAKALHEVWKKHDREDVSRNG